MELKEFIAASLRQVIEAVEEAARHAKNHGADINPSTLEFRADAGQTRMWDEETDRVASEIEFDVAVTASSTAEKGVEGGIKVLGLTVGVSGSATAESANQSVSRIRFSLPVVLPSTR